MPAGFTSASYSPADIVAGNAHLLVSKEVTLLSGQNLVRGTVLGQITLGAVTAAVAVGTGNGVCTPDATTPLLPGAQLGVYRALCTAAASNSGTFQVSDPQGNVLGSVAVGATFANQIKFVIADGSADFVVGDSIAITVAAGSGKVIKSLSAAVDGSQTPDLILAEDCDASSADKETVAYSRGDFVAANLTLGTAHTAASIREGLRAKGIVLI